jgi:hypothetical protein
MSTASELTRTVEPKPLRGAFVIPPKILVFVSDTHCGSKHALLPPGIVDENGAEYRLNNFQAWLWNRWIDAIEWVEKWCGDDPFALIINGDIIEGVHHGTTEVVDPDPAQHGVIAAEALRPFADRAECCFMVVGTECHTKTTEGHIAKAIGCTPPPGVGSYSWPVLTGCVNGVAISAAHHMGASLRTWTEASGLGIALNSERLEAARAGHTIPRIVVRSHRHTFGHYCDGDGIIVATPAWQGSTRFVRKVKPEARPRCGVAMMDFRGHAEGELPDVRYFIRTFHESPRAFG